MTLIRKLQDAGLSYIELGAFVSSKWVPQMADTDQVCKEILQNSRKNLEGISYSCLVPNEEGFQRAVRSELKEVAVFGACTETFSQKNINCSIEESFKRFERVSQRALKEGIKLRAYLSVAFGCPYEGEVKL